MTKIIVAIGFLLAFAAGAVTSWRWTMPAAFVSQSIPPTTAPATMPGFNRSSRFTGFLPRELSLTPEQTEKLNQIWSPMAFRGTHEQDDRRREFRRQRDEAIAALVPAQDRAAYDAAGKRYADNIAALDQEFRRNYDDAVARTSEMLTPDQRVKYEEIRKRMQPWDRGGHGGNGGPRNENAGAPNGRFDRPPTTDEQQPAGSHSATSRISG